MTTATGPDLACFGYLAFAQVFAVKAYPAANSGAQVVQVFGSLAGEGFYAHLDEVKSEIEADCDRYWRGSGVDWRPPKPVAKAVIRRADEKRS